LNYSIYSFKIIGLYDTPQEEWNAVVWMDEKVFSSEENGRNTKKYKNKINKILKYKRKKIVINK